MNKSYAAIVIGASAGGFAALKEVFAGLPADFPAAILVVHHIHPHSDSYQLVSGLLRDCALQVKVAEEKEPIQAGTIYLAPANYHLLVEADRSLALTIDDKVNFSRPSIDVLFETAADTFGEQLLGIVLTGGSKDGAEGLRKISERGGDTIVQDPATAEVSTMPRSALEFCPSARVMALAEIGVFLREILKGS